MKIVMTKSKKEIVDAITDEIARLKLKTAEYYEMGMKDAVEFNNGKIEGLRYVLTFFREG